MKGLWRRIANTGTQGITNKRLKRKVILTNQVAFTALAVVLTYVIVLQLVFNNIYVLSPIAVALLYAFVILLNRWGLHTVSRIFLTVLPTLTITIMAGLMTDSVNIAMKFNLISVIVIPLVFFDINERLYMVGGILWVVLAFIAFDFVVPQIPKLIFLDKTDADINSLERIRGGGIMTFALLSLGVIYLQRLNFKAEKKVEEYAADLNERNSELHEKNVEIEAQSTEINSKNARIMASVSYASRIQNAVLPQTDELNAFFSDFFLINKPCQVLSGDFYYLKKVNGSIVVAVGDCTGHGVPGALMSMLGITFLNEICQQADLSTDRILNLLRDKVKKTLQQSQTDRNSVKDGIDISIIKYTPAAKSMQFSSANHHMYVCPNNSNGEILDLVGDRMPIGIYVKEAAFSCKTVTVTTGDRLYLLSDGYTSQFGGKQGKKFYTSKLKQLIAANPALSLQRQHLLLDRNFEQWKGAYEQIDDVMVLGLQV